jgi:hypothetical protein
MDAAKDIHKEMLPIWAAFLCGYPMKRSLIQTCTPTGHLYRVTCTRCIDTINSPDDGHKAVRNVQKIEINIHEK